MYHCLYHSSTSVYLPTRPSHFISADILRGRWLWEECITVFTTHLPVFTYLLGLPTSSLLTSGGVGGFEKKFSILIRYLAVIAVLFWTWRYNFGTEPSSTLSPKLSSIFSFFLKWYDMNFIYTHAFSCNFIGSTLCRPETTKWVQWFTVKTQMKCSIMWHFIRVFTVC